MRNGDTVAVVTADDDIERLNDYGFGAFHPHQTLVLAYKDL